jgi:predicted amino acid racemase
MRIEVDCERIRRNTEAVVEMCAPHGIDVVGVTKACCGQPDVTRAILAGGVRVLGESRLQNVKRLRSAGIEAEIMMLRLPQLSQVDGVVHLTQTSLNSQVATVEALSRAAAARGCVHRVILMIEAGDRREGVMPERALAVARAMVALPHIELAGVGANVICIAGVLPTRENTQLVVDVAQEIERELGIRLPVVSAGNSASLALILRGEMPAGANQLRVGGALLTGEIDSTGQWPDALPEHDAFRVLAEVVEVETKPSAPEGPLAPNAFGEIPTWEDRGMRRRAILALGRQDIQVEGLVAQRPGITYIGASSDHLILDVTEAEPPVAVGETLVFRPLYGAIATAMASSTAVQVVKPMREDPGGGQRARRGSCGRR